MASDQTLSYVNVNISDSMVVLGPRQPWAGPLWTHVSDTVTLSIAKHSDASQRKDPGLWLQQCQVSFGFYCACMRPGPRVREPPRRETTACKLWLGRIRGLIWAPKTTRKLAVLLWTGLTRDLLMRHSFKLNGSMMRMAMQLLCARSRARWWKRLLGHSWLWRLFVAFCQGAV